MPHRPYEDVRICGHLIDSGIMSQIMDDIVALDGEFETLSFEVGRTNEDESVALLRVKGRDEAHVDKILGVIGQLGAEPINAEDVRTSPASADGFFPEGFYATTNLETAVRIAGRWVSVSGPEMDLGIVIDDQRAYTVAMADVKAGQ
ncbi:TIGR00300 family protein, partial [bacterium]|nr:TIGR00300 family protein [bacterium]